MAIKAVLFDIDGTLIDSNDLHVKAWGEAFAAAGLNFDDQTIHDQIGKGSDMMLPMLVPDTSEAEQDDLAEAHSKAFKTRYLDQARPFPFARDLLMRVHGNGAKVVLASSASAEEIEHYLDLLDVRDIVAETTSSTEVENTKPAPDIFATALEKVAPLSAAEVMVVGDTPYDIEAAAKCGIATVALRSGKFSDDALREAGAVALYDDVAALLAEFDSSPLCD
jgi:HAD superfamily hydrolase (TIGR01509 family)